MKKLFTTITTTLLALFLKAQLAGGVYTIDKNSSASPTNFTSFNAAYNAIKTNGITGAVTFNVVAGSGPYKEHLVINGKIPNSSATNSITFNGNGEVIANNALVSNTFYPIITLSNVNHIQLTNVVITTDTFSTIGVLLSSNADSNFIRNCTIKIDTTKNSPSNFGFTTGGIVISSSTSWSSLSDKGNNCDANKIYNNQIYGGTYGLAIASNNDSGTCNNNEIYSNSFYDFLSYGLYSSGTNNLKIYKNNFSRPTRIKHASYLSVIYVTSVNDNLKISQNKIFNCYGSGNTQNYHEFRGINFENYSSISMPATVDNNVIYGITTAGSQFGISISSLPISEKLKFLHNTISLDDSGITASNTGSTYGIDSKGAGCLFYNNIISITRGGSVRKVGFAQYSDSKGCDYNNFYISSSKSPNYVVYDYSTSIFYPTLSLFQAATQSDSNSISTNPYYKNPIPTSVNADFTPTNSFLNNKGTAVGITYDINDSIRNAIKPDIGAYEFYSPPCLASSLSGTTQIKIYNKIPLGDTTVCQNTTINLDVNLTTGFGSLQTFQWERVKDTLQAAKVFLPAISHPDTSFITNDTSYYYRCKLTCSGVSFYTNWRRIVSVSLMPAGTYTINSTIPTNYINGAVNSNFNSFNDANNALKTCGVNGNVTFNVVPLTGPYNEQLKIDSIIGVNKNNKVIFKGNGNTIAFAPTSLERAVIKLNKADFITFDSIVIDARAGTNCGYGIQLINNADSNTFRKCKILADTSSSNSNFAGIVINASDLATTTLGNTLCDGNSFIQNDINGGYYGITVVGSTTQQNFIKNNTFKDNNISDFYYTGIYVSGTDGTVIHNNSISRPTRKTLTTGYGINFAGAASLSARVSNNKISNFYGASLSATAGMYGISFNSADAMAGNENKVFNNVIYNTNGAGAVTALINTSSDYILYYHNTILIDSNAILPTNNSFGFKVTSATAGVKFINNLIAIYRNGTMNKYALDVGGLSIALPIYFNNNNYFISAKSVNSYIAYTGVSGLIKTLAQWQVMASPKFDSLSYDYDPFFVDAATGNLKPQFYLLNNKGVNVNIAEDILGNTRKISNPDIGAYEFDSVPCPNVLNVGNATIVNNSGNCLGQPIQLNLTGNSNGGSLNFQWQDSIAGGSWQNLGSVRYNPQYDTITSVRNFYRCILTCALTGVKVISNVVVKDINGSMPAGFYTIDSALPTNYTGVSGQNFHTFTEATIALQCGIRGSVLFNVKKGTYNERIIIPYIPGSDNNNSVIFQGINSLKPDAKIISNNATSTDNYIVKFDSAKSVTFKNIIIENINATYGRCVGFSRNASDITIDNCTISSTKTNVTSTDKIVIYADTYKGNNLVIKNNKMNNGSYGLYLTGTAATSGNLTKPGHIIDNNTITNSYSSGIFVQFADKIAIANNIIFSNDTTANNSSCIYANYCDSGFTLLNNKININNNVNGVTGIQIQNSRNRIKTGFGVIANNEVYANANNKGKILGMSISASDSLIVKNNVISINTGALNSIGLVNANNVLGSSIFYYNNTVQIAIVDTNSIAAQITQSNAGNFIFKNNIFSNLGNGKAIYVNNATNIISDYNLIYSSGNTFANTGTLSSNYFQNINKWRTTTQLDKNSIIFKPSFISNVDLSPNIADSNVWAMQGRGIQIKGNDKDINGNYRPDSLTAGVPDIGAYEFLPTIAPPSCNATPANPTPNTTQTFYLGSDTVMRIKWNTTAPATCSVRRFSGVLPPNQNLTTCKDSMFFYTQVQVPISYSDASDIDLNYLENWLGNIPLISSEQQLGLAKTDNKNTWALNPASRKDINSKTLTEINNTYYDKFTGLTNQYLKPPSNFLDTSNIGREFWTIYPANQLAGGSNETFRLYFSARYTSEVVVEIPGIGYKKTYVVAANTTVASEIIPKNIRHDTSGIFKDAIKITSDNPIAVYAHISGGASSAATLLLPTATWGYSYKMLSYHESWGTGSYPFINVIANKNNTKVSVKAIDTVSGMPQVFDTILNKGQWMQIISANTVDDLTGSVIQSIANNEGKCYPIAVFSGDTRTNNTKVCTSVLSGDFLLQQNLPMQFWGKKYLTAPTSRSNAATSFEKNLFRISLQDTNQRVYINGIQVYPTGTLSSCVENFSVSSTLSPQTNIPAYIQFTSSCANYITSNKSIQVAQFLGTPCYGVGDPELMYLTPYDNGITNSSFFRSSEYAIQVNYLTLIGSSKDTPVLCEGGPCNASQWTYIYPHPNYPSTNIYIKYWPTAVSQQVNVSSYYPFVGLTYGLGYTESYGYNIGMNLVKEIQSIVTNVDSVKCKGKSFSLSYTVPSNLDSLVINLNTIKGINPNQNIVLKKPFTIIPPTLIINSKGDSLWKFTLPNSYRIDSIGYQSYSVKAYKSDFESCDNSITITQGITIYPTPKIVNITSNSPVITGSSINLNVNIDNQNNCNFSWSGPNSFTSTNQNPTIANANSLNAGTYKVVASDNICSSTDSTVVIVNAGGSLSIAGQCISPLKKNINNVRVDIKNGIQNTLYSNLSSYQFSFLPSGLNYTIRPTKNNDITKANGVTSIDALLTQRHILNTTKLNSPYKIIAADVDGNKLVNSVDVLRMKRLILGTDTTFTKTVGTTKTDRLWEFVDSAYTFPDTTNPFPFKDSISFTNLTSNKTNQTFIGVKLGDVNYDWNPAVARGVVANSLELIVNSEKQTNNNLQLSFSSSNFNNINALQTTLHFDNTKYEFIGIENGKLQLDYNANKANTTGNIAILWTDKNTEAKSFDKDEVLFTVVLKPITVDSRLSTGIQLSNEIAETEAWDNNFAKRSIVLTQRVVNDKHQTPNNLLLYPNPAHTIVGVKLDKLAGIATLIVTDVYGKQVLKKAIHQSTTTIDIAGLAKGVYMISVITEQGKQTEKLVVE